MSKIRFIGLEVHADTLAVAVAEPNGEVRSIGVIPNRLEAVRKTGGKARQATTDIKKKWTAKYMTWLHDHVHFEPPALAATLADCVQEVHHAGERIPRLEKAIDHAVPKLRNKFVLSQPLCRRCVAWRK